MSTSYGYICRTCPKVEASPENYDEATRNPSECWMNRGDDILRNFYRLRDHIVGLIQGDRSGYLILEVMGHGSAPFEWLVCHHGHEVAITDEYGRTYPIEKDNPVVVERAELNAEYKRVAECNMVKTGVYCPRFRRPDSAAGLCGPCLTRQAICDRLSELDNARLG